MCFNDKKKICIFDIEIASILGQYEGEQNFI